MSSRWFADPYGSPQASALGDTLKANPKYDLGIQHCPSEARTTASHTATQKGLGDCARGAVYYPVRTTSLLSKGGRRRRGPYRDEERVVDAFFMTTCMHWRATLQIRFAESV
ncbi:hypothetical protein C8T65DRAFT_260763 [Cerioporus squamosus]|nr:hypothetical protein C8T65DRAFT_260763 [Cerioporus squamosus]